MHWRRTWQPTPVFLPGEAQGWRSLVGCRLWSRTELDMTEATAAAAATAYVYAHYYFEQPKQNTHMQNHCKSYVGSNLFSKELV